MVSSGTSWPRAHRHRRRHRRHQGRRRPRARASARARSALARRGGDARDRRPVHDAHRRQLRARPACAASRPASPTSSTARAAWRASASASPPWSTSPAAASSSRSTCRSPTCRCATTCEQRFGVPVVIDNDATAACDRRAHLRRRRRRARDAHAHARHGRGRRHHQRRPPVRGASGAAAEIGHIIIDVNGPKCPANCPNHGCLEAYVAGTGHGRGGARWRPSSSPTRPSAALSPAGAPSTAGC